MGRRRIKTAPHEGSAQNQIRYGQKGNGKGQGQHQRQSNNAVLGLQSAGNIACGAQTAHLRQKHGARRNADDTDGQLIEPVGIGH